MRLVWDNDKQPTELAGKVPPRWYVPAGGWNGDHPAQPRKFVHAGDALDWVRYRHLPLQWKTAAANEVDATPATDPKELAEQKPKFVDNFLGYNAEPAVRLRPRRCGSAT